MLKRILVTAILGGALVFSAPAAMANPHGRDRDRHGWHRGDYDRDDHHYRHGGNYRRGYRNGYRHGYRDGYYDDYDDYDDYGPGYAYGYPGYGYGYPAYGLGVPFLSFEFDGGRHHHHGDWD